MKTHVDKQKHRTSVNDNAHAKLKKLEQELIKQLLIEGYKARDKEDAELNAEWEYATFENMDDIL